MAKEITMEELKRHRKKKKFFKGLHKLIVLAVIVALGIFAYYTREKWIPFFDGIATRYLPTTQNDGILADGNYPINIAGGTSYQIGTLENFFAVVNDTKFLIYSTDGEKTVEKQHTFANPILRTNSKKALLYDIGGKKLQLESKYKTVYSKSLEDNIVLARLGNSDNVAVVTKSDKFLSVMEIYDGSGEEIFKWSSVDSRIIDVTFTNASDGCIVTTIGAEGGQLVSKLHSFNFSQKEELWSSSEVDTLVMSTVVKNDGEIIAFGDTKCAYYDNGKIIGSYQYNSKLIDYSNSNNVTGLLFRDEELRESKLVMITDILTTPKVITLEDDVKQVLVEGDKVYVMTTSHILEYTLSGTEISKVSISDEYNDMHKLGNYMFLLGLSDINRIDFNS